MTELMSEGDDSKAALKELIDESENYLSERAKVSANHAFNQGFMVGLLPAVVMITLSFLLTRGSWLASLIIAALMIIALLGFANLTANIASTNAIKRAYTIELIPKIEQELSNLSISKGQFIESVINDLHSSSYLYSAVSSCEELRSDQKRSG